MSGVNFIKSESLKYDGSIDVTKFVFISEETNKKTTTFNPSTKRHFAIHRRRKLG